MDSYEEMIIPEVPKALPNEQLFIYVPIASSDNPGIAKFDDKHFSVDPDGTVHSMSVVTTGDITISPSQWTDATPTIAQFSISPLKMGHVLILMPADDPTKQAAIQARLSMYPAPFPSIGEDVVEFIRAEADNAPAVNMNFVYLVFKTGSVDTRPAIALVGVDAYGEGGGGTASGVDESAVRAIITAMLGNVANERQYSASNPPPYPVTSVNDKTGAVNLNATDVGARPSTWTPTAADVDADPAGTAERKTGDLREEVNGKLADYDKSTAVNNKISSHDTSAESHQDLRQELRALADRLNAALNSDDTSLDDFREIVAYIKSNKTLIDGITSSKVNVTDIVDNLVTNKSNMPLSAAQGVALKLLIDSLEEIVDGKITKEEADRTYAKPSDIPTVPQTLPNPYALSILGKTYNGSSAVALTVDELIEAIKTASGGVIAWIGDDNNIYLSGNLPDATYTAYYEVNGEYIEIGDLTLGSATPDPVTYTIRWVNYGGEVLKTVTVAEGDSEPEYDGPTPTRAEDGQYTYTFKGWDKTVDDATGDVTYTATYTQTAKPSVPTYDNLADPASADWKTGWRLDSSGAPKEDTSVSGLVLTNFVKCANGNDIYIKGVTLGGSGHRVAVYTSNNVCYLATVPTFPTDDATWAIVNEGNGVYKFTIKASSVAYIRFSGVLTGTSADVIITKNEPIS